MIQLRGLTREFKTGGVRKRIADNITATFPTGVSVALLGRNGAGKSSLLRMIAGTLAPDAGEVYSTGTISWPVGFSGSFHGDLTGAQNTKFIARIYGADTEELVRFVADFAELGGHFNAPFRSYSSGMKSRLAFGVSMGLGFDTYLVDEVTSVGDAAFKRKSSAVFRARMENAGAIVVSHSMRTIRDMCEMGAVLEAGQLHVYADLNQAIRHHQEVMAAA